MLYLYIMNRGVELKPDQNKGLEIVKLPTKSVDFKVGPLEEKNIVPRFPTNCVFCGQTGTGKTNLMLNLVTRFYNFKRDDIYLFSLTAKSDDLFANLDLDDDHVFTEENQMIRELESILEQQQYEFEEHKEKSRKLLLIFEDATANRKLQNSPAFIKAFVQNRHLSIMPMVSIHKWKALNRTCRLQAKNVFFFRGQTSEIDQLYADFSVGKMTKEWFHSMVDHATKEPHSFLYINNSVAPENRFRKKLTEQFVIPM